MDFIFSNKNHSGMSLFACPDESIDLPIRAFAQSRSRPSIHPVAGSLVLMVSPQLGTIQASFQLLMVKVLSFTLIRSLL